MTAARFWHTQAHISTEAYFRESWKFPNSASVRFRREENEPTFHTYTLWLWRCDFWEGSVMNFNEWHFECLIENQIIVRDWRGEKGVGGNFRSLLNLLQRLNFELLLCRVVWILVRRNQRINIIQPRQQTLHNVVHWFTSSDGWNIHNNEMKSCKPMLRAYNYESILPVSVY